MSSRSIPSAAASSFTDKALQVVYVFDHYFIDMKSNYSFLRLSLSLLTLSFVFASCGGSSKSDPEYNLHILPMGESVLYEGEMFQFTAELEPAKAGAVISWSSNDNSVATVDNNGLVVAISPGTATITAKYRKAVAYHPIEVIELPSYSSVDFDLPSGNKWATENLGTTSSSEAGDLYAWGEISPKSWYVPATYQWYASDEKLTKYSTVPFYGHDGYVDGMTTLKLEDDAANIIRKGGWRIPTQADWQELIDNCIWQYGSKGGHYGMFISRVVDGETRTIFLPGTCMVNGEAPSASDRYSSWCYYWSSSLVPNGPKYAYYLDAHYKDGAVIKQINQYINEYRYKGITIRPVWKP